LFAAVKVAEGTVISSLHRRHRAVEFKKFLPKTAEEILGSLARRIQRTSTPGH
jgi:hypothetical protein